MAHSQHRLQADVTADANALPWDHIKIKEPSDEALQAALGRMQAFQTTGVSDPNEVRSFCCLLLLVAACCCALLCVVCVWWLRECVNPAITRNRSD